MAHNTNWVYMTAKDMEEARSIGDRLVESGLAACINILGSIDSIFMWKGEIQHDTEVAFIAKTKAGKVPELVEMVKSLHSYEVPCIISLPISDGNPEFINWIIENS
jgi:periplasmic divalent cation tolerance protein